MNISIFQLERIQSLHENEVRYNLTESGFHPFSLKKLLTESQLSHILNLTLGYGQTNGSIPLRKRIAGLYSETNHNQVLVTNGSSEANFVACHTLLEADDEVLMMVPNYMQIWGIAEEMGAVPKAFHLRPGEQWSVDLAELEAQISHKTKMIAICNPNNPSGHVLTDSEMQEIVRLASKVGAWIYADEIYRGAELNGQECPSFIGMYDKVLVNGGLSKAYALPGLRVGWLVGPRNVIDDAWAYHDYTSITASVLSHTVAEMALEPETRNRILTRNRQMLNHNLSIFSEWMDGLNAFFSFIPPLAGGMAFAQYHADINSTELSDYLRINKSVFVVPGDCFGMDHYMRFGIGAESVYLQEGLQLVAEGLLTLRDADEL